MALEIKTSDIRKAIHEVYTTSDQWEDEIKLFMKGIKSGDYLELGDKSIGVEWKSGSNSNDPRFIVFDYGDRRLRDDHFYVQHSRSLTDLELSEIRDAMVRLGMVDKTEFDMEYCLNFDPRIYDSKAIKTSEIRKLVKEAMYKKLPADGEEFPKFMGRRPKSIKSRINRIYKRCDEYGLSSQKFHDDAWAAIGHYKRAIESLGYEVEIWVENGGYRDYDPQDHMPRSKQYEIIITADDDMVIEGYIKCMAAGSVKDPFDAYDTCMVLWPKQKRSYNESIRTSELRQMVREAIHSLNETEKEEYQWPENRRGYFTDKVLEGVYDLTTNEVYYPVEEAFNGLDATSDVYGGVHQYVAFSVRPIISDSYDGDYTITEYNIYPDRYCYLSTVADSDVFGEFDESTKEPFEGFTKEQERIITDFLNREVGDDEWDVGLY